MRRLEILLFILLLLFPVEGVNSFLAESAVIEVKQVVSVYVSTDDAALKVYIPQDDEYQEVLEINASQPFILEKDNIGNELVKFKLSKGMNTIEIKSIVKTKRHIPIKNNKKEKEFSNISLSDREFVKRFLYGSEFEKIGRMTKWVCENIKYDEKYANDTLDPDEILRIKKGVCDEYSFLLISFVQQAGYPAVYEAGYAYDGENFRPHGWVRIYGNYIWDVDPTWCEMPIDALHVKFASLNEKQFKWIYVEGKGINPKIIIYPGHVDFKILEMNASPWVKTKFRFLDEEVPANGFALGEVLIHSKGCTITPIQIGSCVNENNRTVLEPYIYPNYTYFCNSSRHFVIVKGNYPYYICGIPVLTPFGEPSNDTIKITSETLGRSDVQVEKEKIERKKPFRVYGTGHIFTLNGQYAYEKGVFYGEDEDFYVFSLKDGNLSKIKIKVVNNTPFDTWINSSKIIENKAVIEVVIKNLRKEMINLTLSYENESLPIYLSPYEKQNIKLKFPLKKTVKLTLKSGEYSITLYEKIDYKITEEKIFSFINGFIEKIKEVISSLTEFLSSSL